MWGRCGFMASSLKGYWVENLFVSIKSSDWCFNTGLKNCEPVLFRQWAWKLLRLLNVKYVSFYRRQSLPQVATRPEHKFKVIWNVAAEILAGIEHHYFFNYLVGCFIIMLLSTLNLIIYWLIFIMNFWNDLTYWHLYWPFLMKLTSAFIVLWIVSPLVKCLGSFLNLPICFLFSQVFCIGKR